MFKNMGYARITEMSGSNEFITVFAGNNCTSCKGFK